MSRQIYTENATVRLKLGVSKMITRKHSFALETRVIKLAQRTFGYAD